MLSSSCGLLWSCPEIIKLTYFLRRGTLICILFEISLLKLSTHSVDAKEKEDADYVRRDGKQQVDGPKCLVAYVC